MAPSIRRELLAVAPLLLSSLLCAAASDVITEKEPSIDNTSTNASYAYANASSPTGFLHFHLTALHNFTARAANRSAHAAHAQWTRAYTSYIQPSAQRAQKGASSAGRAAKLGLRAAPGMLLRWLNGLRRSLWEALTEQLGEWMEWAREYGGELGASARSLWRTLVRRDRAVSRVLRKGSQRQWYQLLKVRRKATKKQLKDAYRKLAKRVHPDKTKDDRAERAFNMLRDAFDLLNDADQRKRYDKELERADEQLAQRRRRQREKAIALALASMKRGARMGKVVGLALWEMAQENPRVAIGVVAVLALLLS